MLDYERDGVALSPGVVGVDILEKLAEEFDEAGVRVGARPFALSPVIRQLVMPEGILTRKAKEWACADARPVRVLAFDKRPEANWHLPWHQDRVIAVKRRIDLADYGNWTVKNGQPHVEAPARLLETMFNLRLHIDDCDAENGALKVIRGSHRLGRLSDAQVREAAARGPAMICAAPAGGILAMKALTLHASDASKSPRRRRVLHVDYCFGKLPDGLDWALDV
ncbi:phytanoyl-CoA dioxygenase family protein [Taklimakanibacter deserti]|uniref:phytanoyl-CoA dioxygenase family protein n=1 Tax=Taklimakanibacter deserti TaxID=2267839 RepID=UPI000E64DE40